MSDKRRVLVYGAPGAQGGAVARVLLKQGHDVRLLAPDNQDTAALEALGAVRFVGGFEDPASLRRANEGVDAVSLVLPLDYDFDRVTGYGKAALDAAADAGVGHLVFNTSTQYPAAPTGIMLHDIKIALQAMMLEHAVPTTILKPTIYLGNILAPPSARAVMNDGVFAYPLPENHRVAWICWEDLAVYVAAALDRPETAGSVFDVAGPDALTGPEFAGILTEELGHAVRYMTLPTEAFTAGLNQALGAPTGDEIAKFYAWFATQSDASLAVDTSPARAALDVTLTPIRQWVRGQNWSEWRE